MFDTGAIRNDDGEICTVHNDCVDESAPICGGDMQCRGCINNTECMERNPDFPQCLDGVCLAGCTEGPAGDAECAARDSTLPYCVGDLCVECRSDADCTGGQACIESTGVCTACTEHADCDAGACDRDSGTCVAEANIIYVDQNDAAADDAGTCESAAPCETIVGALAIITGTRTVIVVRGDDTVFYGGVLTIDGITATIIGSGASIQPDAGQINTPIIAVSNGADLTLEGFTLIGASGDANADGLHCGSVSALRVHRVKIESNAATGIDADGCFVTITRCRFSGNQRGGINLRDSGFIIINSIINDNGNIATSTMGGLAINNAGTSDQNGHTFSFNTVFRNRANATAAAKGVYCRSDNAVTVTGNIVYGNLGDSPGILGTCTWEYSNVEGGVPGAIAGPGNIDVAPDFVDAAGGDFHLTAESPGVDIPGLTSDILVDFEGDARPQNQLFDMGADEVVPQ